MRIPPLSRTRMLTPTRDERLTASPAVVLLLFLAVMSAAQLARSGISLGATLLIPNSLKPATQLLISLFATSATVGVVLLYCLLAERRSLESLGFGRRGAVLEYVIGLLGGLGMLSAAVLICTATGAIALSPAEKTVGFGSLLLFLAGFLIQGMSEELLCRSYLMVSLSRGWPLWACALTNALLFSLLHLGNPSVSVIALVNIFLFGLFASVLTLRRGSVWMVGALHSMWNFAQGNLFGIPVSGLTGLPAPLRAEAAEGEWQTLVSGGAFGLEGGLAVTAVLAAACAVAVLSSTKKSELTEDRAPFEP